jgi:predicted nucleic acid-binding protein
VPKFARLPSAEVATLLALIESEATMVTPSTRLEVSPHDSDNRFYECADAAQADYIVTGNTRHFTKSHKNTRIVTGRGLLDLVLAGHEKK